MNALNEPPQTLDGPQLLHHLIDWARFSECCALDFTSSGKRQKYTYLELQTHTNFLAARIQETLASIEREHGSTTRQETIPILLPQSPGLYISQLAILQAGAAFCPINLDAPEERIAFVAKDVDAKLIITNASLKGQLPSDGLTVLLVDDFPVKPRHVEHHYYYSSSSATSANDLAYVMYTSGSSGKPKGVTISHLAATQSLLAHQRHIPTFKRFLQFASPSFDVSIFEIFFPLFRGCTLVGCGRSQLLNDLPGVINEFEVDAAELTPTVVGSLVQKRSNVPHLKTLLTIGEMLTRPIIREFGGSNDRESLLYGLYGPTEATIHCTINPRMSANTEPGNIGFPLDTVSVLIASQKSGSDRSELKVLPRGQMGELVLGGPQLAAGYLNREAETRLAFITLDSKSYYRTGDKARMLEDGSIEIFGRIEGGQVKLRGQRVELGEIEDVVYKHQDIKTVAAVVLKGILLVFALTYNHDVTSAEVLQTCSKWLPKSMVPSQVVLLQRFPYLPSGKVDKRQLEASYEIGRGHGAEKTFIIDPHERAVTEIITELLGQHAPNTRLQALGLDSLVAIRVASKLRAFNYRVSPVSVLQCNTTESLALLCKEADKADSSQYHEDPVISLEQTNIALNGNAKDIETIIPCSPLQNAMLAETAMAYKAYWNWIELDIHELTDLERARSALGALAECTPMIRIGFMESYDGSGYVQIVWKQLLDSQIEVVDHLDYAYNSNASLLRPLHCQLLLTQSGIKVLLRLHHALYDAWSIELLLDDLECILDSLYTRGRSSQIRDVGPGVLHIHQGIRLPGLRPSFQLVVNGFLSTRLLPDPDRTKQYWKDHLSQLQIRSMPNLHDDKASPPGLATSTRLTSILTPSAEAAARSFLTSPQSIFQAAYVLVLCSYLGSLDVCFGTVFSGRNLPIDGIEDIIGPCLTTLPIRVDTKTYVTLRDIVQDLDAINRKHLENIALPLWDIKSVSGNNHRRFLFDTLFVWQQTLHSYNHARKHVSLIDTVDNVEFNLILEVIPGTGNVQLKANYQTLFLSPPQVENLLAKVERTARLIIDYSAGAVQSVFDGPDEDPLSIQNPHPDEANFETTIGSCVERIAICQPDQPAVEFARSISLDSEYAWNALEIQIALGITKTLKISRDDIGPDTSFFNIGIDSISAITLARHVRDATGKCVEMSDVMKFSSVTCLAKHLQSKGANTRSLNNSVASIREFALDPELLDKVKIPLEQAGKSIASIYILTPLQEAMLAASDISKNKTYVNHTMFEISGNIDRLHDCWKEMAKRHEILRTCFVNTGMLRRASVQVVLEEHEPEWNCINALENNNHPIIAEVERNFVRNELEPPYMLTLVKVHPNVQKLVLTIHHALYDGIAMAVLYGEIEQLYHREDLPRETSFLPFLQNMASLDLNKADQFWKTMLKDYLPFHFVKEGGYAQAQDQTTMVQRQLSASSLEWIENAARSLDTTLLAVCHTIWASLLSEKMKKIDVCFGTVVSGRTLLDNVDRLVAPCFNTIPVRLQNTHRLSYLEAFRHLQSSNVESLPFHMSPLRRIQSKLSLDGSRLFDTLFILQPPTKRLDTSIWTISEDTGAMDFPLVFELVPSHDDNTLQCVVHSHHCVVSSKQAQSILNNFDHKLRESLDNPRRPLISSLVKEEILFRNSNIQTVKRGTLLPTKEMPPKQMSPLETNVRNIISLFTDVPAAEVRRDTSIFRLGLDSISSVQVATQLRKTGHPIRASDILENPTVAQIAAFLETNSVEKQLKQHAFDFAAFDDQFRKIICQKHGLSMTHTEAVRPCTPVQQGMIAQSLHSGGVDYWNSTSFELDSSLTLPKYREAWDVIVSCYEILRTGFVFLDNLKFAFAMVIFDKENFSVPWNDKVELHNHNNLLQPWNITVVKRAPRNLVKLTAHHALYDAQSMQMILSDVAKYCSSQALVDRPPVAPLLAEILLSADKSIEDKKSFWQSEDNHIVVNRFPDLTTLSVDIATTYASEYISKYSLQMIEKLCREHGVTVQAATQAVWAKVLSSYTGEAVTTFGTTLSGRSIHLDANRTSFPTIITIPVNLPVTGTNGQFLARAMSLNVQLHKHQFTPLASIQKWAGLSDRKIFETLFAYQKLPEEEEYVEIPWRVVEEQAYVDYAVSMEVQPLPSGEILLRLSSKTSLIPTEHANLILRQYEAVLLDTLQNPQSPCKVASDSVAPELLSITPARENEIQSPVTLLHGFVERGAMEWPQKSALEFATCLELGAFTSVVWSYADLDRDSNKVAHMLLQCGALPGQLVAICFEKCPEATFAIIGILKAGCAYVALDPTAPPDRMNFIVEDSGTSIVLTAGKPANSIRDVLGVPVIELDLPLFQHMPHNSPVLAREISPQDACYCLYTSGTSGLPKGCLISHESAVQAMLSFQRLFAGYWTDDSKWLQFASFHFDVSVLEQFWSWSVGICVASAPRDLIFEDIAVAIRQLSITHIDLTPSLARSLHPEDVPSLCRGVFVTGGEQLKQDILDVWGDRLCIYNGYGPTEATIGVTMYPRVPKNGKASNIGCQFDNVGSYVLMPNTTIPVLRGGVGELVVSGKLVGNGYLNRPDLTSKSFPTLPAFGERVYRTGDLVRILHDGSFLFLGRADDQVKLRGQRLELREVNEVVKKSHVDIEEVVTLLLRHQAQGKEQLVSFFVSKSQDAGNHVAMLKSACQRNLPGYMVPTHFIPVDFLPLNSNNKADTQKLANIFNDLTFEYLQKLCSYDDVQDWSGEEHEVLDIIARHLNIEASTIIRNSSIFELGLDSISIIAFANMLQTCGFEHAKLSVIKNHPILGSLVDSLLEHKPVDNGRGATYLAARQIIIAFAHKHFQSICQYLNVTASDIEAIAPCTPVQEGMVYRFLESDNLLYFHTFRFQLHADVDQPKLLEAWYTVVKKLQILRTIFVPTDDGYAQVVMNDMSASTAGVEPPLKHKHKSYWLKRPWLLEIESHTASANILQLQIFHALYDGISLETLLRCLLQEYHEEDNIDYGPRFHDSLSYGPLAKMQGAESFWRCHLEPWCYKPLPIIAETETTVLATKNIYQLNSFETLRKSLGITPQTLIQATWLAVLQNVATPKLTIGIVTSGRSIDFVGADKVIGPLFNTVPLNVEISSGMDMKALIHICHQYNMSVQDFQHTPLKDIQRWSTMDLGQALFDNLFVFQRPNEKIKRADQAIWTQLNEHHDIDDYALALEATLSENSTELSLLLVARASVITELGAEDLLRNFKHLLENTLRASATNMITSTTTNGNALSTVIPHSPKRLPVDIEHFPYQPFIWTEQAVRIRGEIAILSNVREDNIKENSSIFELGLDSIDVIKLASRLKKRGADIPVSTIIKCQTIASMHQFAQARKPPRAIANFSILDISRQLTEYLYQNRLPCDVEAVLPATPLQQTMYNEMIVSGFQRYYAVDTFEIAKYVDIDKLLAAVRAVIAQSPILRTSFVEVADPRSIVSYAQIIRKSQASDAIGYEVLCETASVECLMKRMREEMAEATGSKQDLCQIRLLSSEQKQYLCIGISHALYDGRSLQIFHDDIHKAYYGETLTRPDLMPYLEGVFTSTTKEAEQYWRGALTNIPLAPFPRKVSHPIAHINEVHRLERKSMVSLHTIEAICRSCKITMQTLGQTCWALVLSQLMGQLDVIFGSVLSCRDTEEANEVIFPLMNTVAVRSVLHGSLVEMVKYMQAMSDTTREYQHLSLAKAQAIALATRNDRNQSTDTRLFDTLYIYQGRRQQPHQDPLYESVSRASDIDFAICVEMEIVDDQLIWITACQASARDAVETEGIIDSLDLVLRQLATDTTAPTVAFATKGISSYGLPSFSQATEPSDVLPVPKERNSATWSETERALRHALHVVSSIPEESIQKHTTIFHLGLDSISALKLPALLKSSKISLSVSTILRHPTIASMTKHVLECNNEYSSKSSDAPLNIDAILADAMSATDYRSQLLEYGIDIENINYIMPVTAGQAYMIRHWQQARGSLFYYSFKYELTVDVDLFRLEKAWTLLLQRHDILRTGFIEVKGYLLQFVYKVAPKDVRDMRSGIHKAKPCELQNTPVNLFIKSEGDYVTLILRIHHALYDGISLPVLLQELEELYQSKELSAANSDFKHFVARSLSVVKHASADKVGQGRNATQQLWIDYLKPAALRTPPCLSQSTKRTELYEPSLPFLALQPQAKKLGITIDSLLLATIAKTYAQKLRSTCSPLSITFGIYLANRSPFSRYNEDFSTLAAPTLNILPLCVHNALGKGITELGREIQKDVLRISGEDMVFASLQDIYQWTDVRIDFCVNLLKHGNVEGVEHRKGQRIIKQIQGSTERRVEEVDVDFSAEVMKPDDKRSDAYLPSIDIEIRYHETTDEEGKVDIGIFGPTDMLTAAEAKGMVETFLGYWS